MEDVGQDQQTALQHPCRVVCSRDITLEPSKGDQIISASNQQPDQPTTSPNSSKEKALSIVASSPSAKFLPFFIVVIGIDLAVALGIESWCFVAPLALIPHSSSPSPTTLRMVWHARSGCPEHHVDAVERAANTMPPLWRTPPVSTKHFESDCARVGRKGVEEY